MRKTRHAILVLAVLLACISTACSRETPASISPTPSARASGTEIERTPDTQPTGTAVASTATQTASPPELSVMQAVGLRGCEQPVYVVVVGAPSSTAVRLERVDAPSRRFTDSTSATGFLRARVENLLGTDCTPGGRYAFRIVEDATGNSLATTELEVPVFSGRIEIDPPSGGCTSITVTFRGFAANARVTLLAQAPDPMSHNGFSVIAEPPMTDAAGFARTEPFRPPWLCGVPALALFALTGEGLDARQAELLYRIAVGPNDLVPGLQ